VTFDDYCTTILPLATRHGGIYDRAKAEILEDRDAWLDLGMFLLPITVADYADRRGLPVFRVPAGGVWVRPAPAMQRIPARY
jgi:hypothetical protein